VANPLLRIDLANSSVISPPPKLKFDAPSITTVAGNIVYRQSQIIDGKRNSASVDDILGANIVCS